MLLALTLALAGCSLGPGPPHPGAANPYSSGGFHDAGPNYPDTGLTRWFPRSPALGTIAIAAPVPASSSPDLIRARHCGLPTDCRHERPPLPRRRADPPTRLRLSASRVNC